MIATIIIIILVTGGSVSNFYLKKSVLDSFSFLIASIIGLLVAFTYYEPVSAMIINKGFMVQAAQGLSLFIIYTLTTVIVGVISDQIVGSNIDFGHGVKIATTIVCGLLVGLISSGIIVTSLGTFPPIALSYNRFDDTIHLQNAKSLIVPVDSFVTGLYGHMADGAMSSKKKFSFYHSDFLNHIYINRHRSKENALLVAGKGAVSIPKNGVKVEDIDDSATTLIRIGIKNKKISDGGIATKKGTTAITPGQFRLVCQKKKPDGSFSGEIKTIYPVTYRIVLDKDDSRREVSDLGVLVILDRDNFKNRTAPVELAFKVPSGMTANYLQFRNNVMIEVPWPATKEQLENEGDPFAEKG